MTSPMGEFDYCVTGDRRVRIAWRGKHVVTLAGARARSFLARSAHLEGQALQQLLARVTGNFKRGNERRGRNE